jgi:hypothetical protein
MGLREFRWFIPARDLLVSKYWRIKKEVPNAPAG